MNDFGATLNGDRARFAVYSRSAEAMALCLFDANGVETRLPMKRGDDNVWRAEAAGASDGDRYGFRAGGRYAPEAGFWFDPSKLLTDPCAVEIDRPWVYDKRLGVAGVDTAALVPKAVLKKPYTDILRRPPLFAPGGFIYEAQLRAFTINHPDVAPENRGTLAALGEAAVLAHLKKLGVDAVELMPIVAWIDEGHLPPLGLSNAWGYNPVSLCALDPRFAPGGFDDLRDAVAALHGEGIGVILDVVFNHSGESDNKGPMLSMRGLDNSTWYRLNRGRYVNDTGCGNTLDCANPVVIRHIVQALRHFVLGAGVDGFRFDLATTLARTPQGYSRHAPLLEAMARDEVLADRVMIAEPWDIGPGGYQLGNFPSPWLEWNDRYRDDVRRYWRGDGDGANLATRLAGSSDIFEKDGVRATRSVNFIAAHDGFALADIVAYRNKHNKANGENNRDGHNENYSWNGGVEGPTDDEAVLARRRRSLRALLATLFLSRGTIMLTAGDEFGRTQHGNNNAYAQDNAITWLDWNNRDRELEGFVAALSALRRRLGFLRELDFFDLVDGAGGVHIEWRNAAGEVMREEDWRNGASETLTMAFLRDKRELLRVVFDRRAVEVIIDEPTAPA